ncbi:Pyrroline-5-carboxylate reductase [Paraliobacillus sp. PM-2]|uniref:pyrroline-5-carboxylate reductase n=1 Tax=Paraliobacillus sp. PM-2 TaxID=1462524 RepID=UPI00061C98FE|nr:pyrroline-5-carboxylate reductase [Paraliobacillus sp. PM-2]CQR45782.1 Pyrroline-5-carboxylate reductase [Paraliobacillus sp. PM-2]
MLNKIAFIGAGSMAEALIAGMIKAKMLTPDQITVTNKSNQARLKELLMKYKVRTTSSTEKAVVGADAVIFAIKPKDITHALTEIKPFLQPSQLLISILAGTPIALFTEKLQQDNPVIRAMPNTSATIGYGATAMTAGKFVTADQLEQTKQLFETVGNVSIVNEEQMHVVTAVSGSGPAYFYYIVEAMETAAIKNGLESDVAKDLIYQTILGAAEMLQQTDLEPYELRKNITSPNGTTQSGIEALMDHEVDKGIEATILAALKRSKELGESKK